MKRRAVITGMGLLSPLGDSPAAVFDALCQGRSAVLPLGGFDSGSPRCHLGARLADFRAEKYLSGRSLHPLDRASQMATAACGLALADAGWTTGKRASSEMSLVLGTMFSGMHTIAEFDRISLTSGPGSVSPMTFANTVINAAAGQAAIWHNLRGLNSTLAAGSIAGLRAIGYAADLIREGRCPAVLAGGLEEFSFESFVGFDRTGLLCSNHTEPECPVPFDWRRNGFALGEGAGFLLLEDAESARARDAAIVAEVKGSATAFDYSRGRDSSLATETLARAMRMAIARSGIAADDIDFVSASANGSVLSDCVELSALTSVFPDSFEKLPVTAIKCGIGEALGASGPTQVAVAVETLNKRKLPGVIGLEELPHGCEMRGIRPSATEVAACHALINAVGTDGHCCSLVLSSFDN